MDSQGIDFAVDALKCADQPEKRSFIVEAFERNDLLGWTGYFIDAVAREIYDGDIIACVKAVKVHNDSTELGTNPTVHEFFSNLAMKLEKHFGNICASRKYLSREYSADYLPIVEWLYRAVCSDRMEKSQGLANQLARKFGEACNKVFIASKIYTTDVGLTNPVRGWFYVALSEGYVKRCNPNKVAKAYIQLSNAGQDEAKPPGNIAEAEESLRAAVKVFNRTDQSSHDKVSKCFEKLVGLCDGDTRMALKAVEEVDPTLLGEFAAKYCDKRVGGTASWDV